MPTINDLKQSKFLTKADVMTPVLGTIRGYDQVNVAKEGVEPEMKWCLHFNEFDKPLVLNSTNGQIIAAFTGSEDFDGWIGKQVVLYNDPNISFGGKLTGGIRCRAPKVKPASGPVVGTVGQILSPTQKVLQPAQLKPEPESDSVPF